jgi:nucleoside 2-deoxyribosyltransferase
MPIRHDPPRLVYVAGNYTAHPGHPETHNVGEAIAAGAAIEEACPGVYAFVPHVSMLTDVVRRMPADYWYEFDLEVMTRCDAVVVAFDRNGSKGVALERTYARCEGIPVHEGVDAFIEWFHREAR